MAVDPVTGKDTPNPDDTKTAEQIAADKATADAAAAQKKVADDAVAAAKLEWDKTIAPPEKYDLKSPEGFTLRDTDLAEIADEAKALKLTQAQAAALVEARVQVREARKAAFLEDLKADPTLGGKNFESTVQVSQRGVAFALTPGTEWGDGMKALLNETGLGNHKWVVAMFAAIGKKLKEDQPLTPRDGIGDTVTKRDAAEVLYGGTTK